MNRIFLAVALALTFGAGLALADHPESATARDITRLEADLNNLDYSLDRLPASHPRYSELRDRADTLQEDVVALKAQVERHRRSRNAGLGATRDEVADLRRDIASLRTDVDAATGARDSGVVRTGGALTLPEGTAVSVRLMDSLSSKTSRAEDRFEAQVSSPVIVNGALAIPAGTRVSGTVHEADDGSRLGRAGRLSVSFDTLWLDDQRVDIRSRVLSLDEGGGRSETAKRAGIGAAIGGLLGAIIDGKKGALVGVLVGGSGGVITGDGGEVSLPSGSVLTLSLLDPVRLRR